MRACRWASSMVRPSMTSFTWSSVGMCSLSKSAADGRDNRQERAQECSNDIAAQQVYPAPGGRLSICIWTEHSHSVSIC